MHNVFLCKFYQSKCFARMLNSRVIKFANISENKEIANNTEFKMQKLIAMKINYYTLRCSWNEIQPCRNVHVQGIPVC